MKKIILLFLLAISFSFCKNKKTEPVQKPNSVIEKPKVQPLTFVQDSVVMKSELCANENESECAEVSINYLKVSGGEEGIAAKINKTILEILGKSINYPGDTPKNKNSIELIAQSFIVDYDRMVESEDSFNSRFGSETDSKILYESHEIISISIANYSYTGGAHGNYFTNYYNFNKANGELLKATEILKNKDELSKLLENQVRKHHKIEAGTDVKDFGFMYEGDQFPVNDNIAILKDSLVFMYNPYEIGPYVLGDMELKIAKSEIQNNLILK